MSLNFRKIDSGLSEKISQWPKEAFWVFLGMTVSAIALLFGTKILTNLLSVAEYGRLALGISLSNFAVQIFGIPVGKTAIRFYTFSKENGRFHSLKKFLKKSIIESVVCIISLFLLSIIIGIYCGWDQNLNFCILTFLFTVLMLLNSIACSLEDAARKRRLRALVQGSLEVVRFLFAIVFIYFFSLATAETVLSGFVLSGFMIVLAHSIFLRRVFLDSVPENGFERGKKLLQSDTEMMKYYQRPLILSNAFLWIMMMSERWVLKGFVPIEIVGGYCAVYQLSFIPMLLVGNFVILLTEPIIYQITGTNGSKRETAWALRANRILAIIIIVVSVGVFMLLLFYYPVIGRYVLGNEFRPYSWIFPWLILAGGSFAASQQLLIRLTYEMKTVTVAFLWGVVAAVSVVSYLISAKYWLLEGLVFSVVIVNVLFVCFLLFYLGKQNFDFQKSQR